MKRLLTLAAAAAIGGVLFFGASGPAEAAGCYYRLYQDGKGIINSIQGYGHAAKLKHACNRARRECNRRFERARKQGKLPRGGPRDFRCVRTTAG